MVKHINENSLNVDFVGEDELMYGRNYIRELYERADVYDFEQYRFWLNYLETLALSSFEWVGMPEGIDTRAVEYIMLHFGIGAMFTEWGGHLFAQAAPSSNINMYYNPNQIMLCAPSGQTWERHCEGWVEYVLDSELGERLPIYREKDAVILFDNMRRYPVWSRLRYYAKRLATIDRVMDVNIGAQRTPWLISMPEEAVKSGDTIVKDLMRNKQVLKVTPQMANIVNVDVLTTLAPYVAKDLQDTKKQILYDVLTLLGIDNANTEKKERMIDHEATSNNEQILLARRSRLECRRTFCEKCNALWGLDMSVQWGAPHLLEGSEYGDSELTPTTERTENSATV